jgi:flagellar hook protein FlgE
MMRSLFSGVSGLRNHQFRMDVIGNNIANVNTVSFKTGRVAFKEGFAQLLTGAQRPPGDQGGTNPIQIGLGSQIGSVDTLFAQGNLETTGLKTDVAIQGNAFFVVRKGNQSYYTRAGNFQLDGQGELVSPTNGFVVQGRMATNGVLSDSVTDITLPFGQKVTARPTSKLTLAGNLDASATNFDLTAAVPNGFNATTRAAAANSGSYQSATIAAFDQLGNKVETKVWLWKTGANQWDWKLDTAALPTGWTPGASTPGDNSGNNIAGRLQFDPNTGLLSNSAITTNYSADVGTAPPATLAAVPTGAWTSPQSTPVVNLTGPGGVTLSMNLDLGATMKPSGATSVVAGSLLGLTQFAGQNNAVMRDQNGFASGTLQDFSVDRTGTITGSFTNGTSLTLGQIVLADFNNPSGLLRVGDNMYAVSGNSGTAVLGYALSGSQSAVTSGALEMSNVDLAQEFTNMIVAQRGFQANSKVITTADELLSDVVGLKR